MKKRAEDTTKQCKMNGQTFDSLSLGAPWKTVRARTVRTRAPDGTTSGGAVNVVNEI